jgi:sugar phosphate isomerase/epimerase
MKLGLLTAAFPTLTLDEIADWASAGGFETLEVACWPAGEGAARRYAGVCHIDVDTLDDAKAKEIGAGLERRGLSISALAYYPNALSPDADARAAVHEHLRKVIAAAPLLGVDTVGTFVGRDRAKNLPDSLDDFRATWPPLVAHAAEHGVRIAIENCPMIFSYDEWPGGDNLAYAPAIWREMFTAIPDDNFGLNFDPSHLIWQMIDVERAVHEFGERIFHVHGKDLEVRPDGLYEHGVMSAGIGWQVPRLCGLGLVDWGRFVGALYAVEHEDRRFEGSVELVQRGFLIARNTLRPLLA